MSDFKKLAHAIWQCKYHVVWCPKYRFKILKGALQKSVKEIISQLCEWKKVEILEMNVLEDQYIGHISSTEICGIRNNWFHKGKMCHQDL